MALKRQVTDAFINTENTKKLNRIDTGIKQNM